MEALQLVIHAEGKERDLAYLGCDWFDDKYLMQNIPLITQLNVLEWRGCPDSCSQAGFLCAWERASQKTAMSTCSWMFHSEAWVVILKEWCTHQLHQNHQGCLLTTRVLHPLIDAENESLQRREMWNGEERIVNIYLHQSLNCITYIKKARSKVRTRICKVLKDKHFSSLYPL